MNIISAGLSMVAMTATSLVQADRVVRNADGTPISVRVERKPASPDSVVECHFPDMV